MKLYVSALFAGAALCVATGTASAQVYYPQPQVVHPAAPGQILQGSGVYVNGQPLYQPQPQFMPSTPVFPQPSVPQFVTPNSAPTFNPATGQWESSNTQINNSAFDPGRTQSMTNGSMQQVNRPIYDRYGNIVGRQNGVEWYNPQTGRMNGQVENQTVGPNGVVNKQQQFYAPNPMAGRKQ